MNGQHKLRIKIGDAEFEAEGSEEAVKQQYAEFLAALSTAPAASKKLGTADAKTATSQLSEAPDASLISQAFEGEGETISLKFLPKTETQHPDALLLLLYGYDRLKNQPMVLGTQLLKAAKQSGLQIDRIDRSIAAHEGLLLRGGTRKGTKYGLNNQGKIKALEVLRQCLE